MMEGQSDKSVQAVMITRGFLMVAVFGAIVAIVTGLVTGNVALVGAFALLGAVIVRELVQNLRETRSQ